MATYKVNDFVTYTLNGSQKIGLVEKIEGKKVFTKMFISPLQTHSGKRPFHSKKEIFETDCIEEIQEENIGRKVNVVLYNGQNLNNIDYLYRQKYDLVKKTFTPDPVISCICKRILNPDDELLKCYKCGEMQHKECIKKYEDFSCFKCSEPLNIAPELTQSINEESILFKKRTEPERTNIFSEIIKKDNEEEIAINNSDSETIKIKKIDETNVSLIKSKSHYPNTTEKNPYKGKFKNLSEKSTEYLENLALKLEARYSNTFNASSNKGYIGDRYDRTKTREKFKFSLQIVLIYGIQEIKEKKNFQNFQLPIKITSKNSNEEEEAINTFCRELATKIECSFHETFKATNEYTNKLRSLYTNLLNPDNIELRIGILSGTIQPEDLPSYTHNNLANEKLKKQREEREKKYLKEECLLSNDNEKKFIMQSQKGITVVDLEKEKELDNFQREFLKDLANNNQFYQGPSNENENKEDEDIIKEIAQEGITQSIISFDSNSNLKETKEVNRLNTNNDLNPPESLIKSQPKDIAKNLNSGCEEKYIPQNIFQILKEKTETILGPRSLPFVENLKKLFGANKTFENLGNNNI